MASYLQTLANDIAGGGQIVEVGEAELSPHGRVLRKRGHVTI